MYIPYIPLHTKLDEDPAYDNYVATLIDSDIRHRIKSLSELLYSTRILRVVQFYRAISIKANIMCYGELQLKRLYSSIIYLDC